MWSGLSVAWAMNACRSTSGSMAAAMTDGRALHKVFGWLQR